MRYFIFFIYDGISWDIQWVYLESNLAMDITHLIDSFPSYKSVIEANKNNGLMLPFVRIYLLRHQKSEIIHYYLLVKSPTYIYIYIHILMMKSRFCNQLLSPSFGCQLVKT